MLLHQVSNQGVENGRECMKLLNKKGITLIELLGALVILGIAFSLFASLIAIIVRSSNSSVEESKINTEGLFMVRTIESRLSNVNPNRIQLEFSEGDLVCTEPETASLDLVQTECLKVARRGTTVLSGSSIVITDDFDDELIMYFSGTSDDYHLLMNGDRISSGGFRLDPTQSYIVVEGVRSEVESNSMIISLKITLLSQDGRQFTFRTSNALVGRVIDE